MAQYDEEKLKAALSNQFKPLDTPSNFDVSEGDTTTKTSIQPPTITAPEEVLRRTIQTPKTEDTAIADKVTSSHPMQDFSALDDQVKNDIAQTNQYGPEQEKAVMNNIMQSQNSLPEKFRRGGAALSDALMQGVARAGNPGNLKGIQDEEQNQISTGMNLGPKLQEMSQNQIGMRNKLEEMSSGTPLGKAMAAALLDIVKTVYPGKTDADYQKMMANPAATASALGIAAPLLESKAKIKMAEAELGLHRQVAGATEANQQEERRQAALKLKAEHPILNAMGKLDENGGGNFDHSSIPSGTVYKAPDGTMRKKK